MSDTEGRPTRSDPVTRALRSVLGIVVGLVRVVTGVFAAILVARIVLVIFETNPENSIARLITRWSDGLTLGLRSLFLVQSPTLQGILSYGLPALVWLALGAVVVRVLQTLGARGA